MHSCTLPRQSSNQSQRRTKRLQSRKPNTNNSILSFLIVIHKCQASLTRTKLAIKPRHSTPQRIQKLLPAWRSFRLQLQYQVTSFNSLHSLVLPLSLLFQEQQNRDSTSHDSA